MRMVRFTWVRFVVAGVLVLAGAIPAFAQGQGNAVLTGTVTDPDGVVPGATVTAIDAATSITRSAVSNEQGTFRLLALPPGRYTAQRGNGRLQENHDSRPCAVRRRNPRSRQADAAGRRPVREHHRHRGSDSGADHRQQPAADRDRRPAHDDPGQGARRVRHDEDPAGRRRHHLQPRLRPVELGARLEHQRRQLAEQEHDD